MSATATLDVFKRGGILPQSYARQIIARANEASVVQKLAKSVSMPITGTSISVQTSQPQAGVVGEGQLKPVTSMGLTYKSIKPIKVAAVMYWSKEAREADEAGYLKVLEQQAAAAITRAFDLAVLHGKSALTGQEITGVEFVNQTTNRVELGGASKDKGSVFSELMAGTDLVNLNPDFDFEVDGIAATPELRSRLYTATDTTGRPLYNDAIDLKAGLGNVMGLPVAYSRSVSGKVGAAPDTKVKGFAGDWSTLQYGFVDKMALRYTDQSTIVDSGTTVHLWQQNMEAMLVEAQFGWVFTDKSGFVAFEDKVADK